MDIYAYGSTDSEKIVTHILILSRINKAGGAVISTYSNLNLRSIAEPLCWVIYYRSRHYVLKPVRVFLHCTHSVFLGEYVYFYASLVPSRHLWRSELFYENFGALARARKIYGGIGDMECSCERI